MRREKESIEMAVIRFWLRYLIRRLVIDIYLLIYFLISVIRSHDAYKTHSFESVVTFPIKINEMLQNEASLGN